MIEHPIPTTLLAAVLWRRLDVTSLEHCRLLELPDFYILEGRVLTILDGHPSEVHYRTKRGFPTSTGSMTWT